MSEAVKGVIQKINYRENKNGEDKFGNTHRASICIDDQWYGWGGCKDKGYGLQISVKQGSGWHNLAEGDTVQFFANVREYNGKDYYDKEGQAKLVTTGSGAPPAQTRSSGAPASAAPAKARTTATAPGRPDPTYAVARWVNGAVSLLAAKDVATLNEGVLKVAALEAQVTEHFDAIWAKAQAAGKKSEAQPEPETQDEEEEEEAPPPPPKPKAKATAKTKPAPEATPSVDDGFDDEIPF